MTDQLLPYYQRELSHIRRQGAMFAEAHPDVAERLRLDADHCDDPHVERMIEAFAYLTARIRHKLDDEFPELTDAVINTLYPHYLAPVPSMAVTQFTLAAGHDGRYEIPRGTMLETDPVKGRSCRFRTGYDVQLWPIVLEGASLGPIEMDLGEMTVPAESAGVLRLHLRCRKGEMRFHGLGIDQLRLYLHGQRPTTFKLYELLMNRTTAVVVRSADRDARRGEDALPPAVFDAEVIRPVGFTAAEGLLPNSARTFPGYTLLTEYFAFPEKFMFVELAGLKQAGEANLDHEIEILIFLSETSTDLEHAVSAETFRLGCVPVINLFSHRADPIEQTHTELSYRVVPDARRPNTIEVYSIDRVMETTGKKGGEIEYRPFFDVRHGDDPNRQGTYWYARRERARDVGAPEDEGTEVYLSFVDLSASPAVEDDRIVSVDTTCLNRDLPHRLPFGGGQPRMHLPAGGPIEKIECLTPPTRTLRPPLKEGAIWRLISHLNLNHLSISGGGDGAAALREMLELYDFAGTSDSKARVASVLDVQSRRRTFRAVRDLPGSFCRGIETTILFDEDRFSDHGLFLLASVIERFLGMYCSMNSVCRMVARTRQREEDFCRWPPRAGERALL